MSSKLTLIFVQADFPQLLETRFTHPLLSAVELRCIRGKTAGAYQGCYSFQWTRAVQAFCGLAVKSMANFHNSEMNPILSGESGSLASSLDYAIDKQPSWLTNMLGCDSRGTLLVRRMINRSNSGRKRPGPVALAWNNAFLPPQEISLIVDGKAVTNGQEILCFSEQLMH